MITAKQQGYLDRMYGSLERAEARVARTEGIIHDLKVKGVNTSTFDPRTSAQSVDFSLLKLRGQAAFWRMAIRQYRNKLGLEPDLSLNEADA